MNIPPFYLCHASTLPLQLIETATPTQAEQVLIITQSKTLSPNSIEVDICSQPICLDSPKTKEKENVAEKLTKVGQAVFSPSLAEPTSPLVHTPESDLLEKKEASKIEKKRKIEREEKPSNTKMRRKQEKEKKHTSELEAFDQMMKRIHQQVESHQALFPNMSMEKESHSPDEIDRTEQRAFIEKVISTSINGARYFGQRALRAEKQLEQVEKELNEMKKFDHWNFTTDLSTLK